MARKLKDDDIEKDKAYKMMPSVAYQVEKRLKADKERANRPQPIVNIPLEALAPPPPPPKPDRPSRFRLEAFGGFHQLTPEALPVLKVETPVENGELLWKIAFTQFVGSSATSMGSVCYPQDNIPGVASFVHGYLNGVGGSAHKVELNDNSKKLCQGFVSYTNRRRWKKLIKGQMRGAMGEAPKPRRLRLFFTNFRLIWKVLTRQGTTF